MQSHQWPRLARPGLASATAPYQARRSGLSKSRRPRTILRRAGWLGAALLLLLASCALPRREIKPEAPIPLKDELPAEAATLGASEAPVIELAAGALLPRALEPSDALPEREIGAGNPINLSDATFLDALRLVLQGQGIPVVAELGMDTQRLNVIDLKGSLSQVLDRLSAGAGLYYSYQDGLLRVSGDRSFVVTMPPLLDDATYEEISKTVEMLGANAVRVDRGGSVVTFRANRRAYEQIRRYFETIRSQKALIVYETHFWEVALTDQRQLGINWNKFQVKPGPTSLSLTGGSQITDSLGLGFVYSGARLSIDMLASFLQTQGTVSSRSNPQLALIGGHEATIRVGQITRYVKQIGSTTTGTGIVQNTVDIGALPSGVDLTLQGDMVEDTVWSHVRLDVSDVTRVDTVQIGAQGQSINLPQTSNRLIDTIVRARPGDFIRLGGFIQTRDALQRGGIPTGLDYLFPKSLNDEATRTELVVVLRPRVIRFKPMEARVGQGEGVPSRAAAVAAPSRGALPARTEGAEPGVSGRAFPPAGRAEALPRRPDAGPRPSDEADSLSGMPGDSP